MGNTEIKIPFPDATGLSLRFGIGACRVEMAPGGDDLWVSGTYEDPDNRLPLKIEHEGANVRITQDERNADWLGVGRGPIPRLSLRLGRARPYMLSLEGGAGESEIDLGGLPVQRLAIRQGAGKFHFDFSSPNPEVMTLLDLDAGAAEIEMRRLANANANEITIDGGAASYRFDFGGQLQHPAFVRLNAGVAGVEVRVPSSTAARISAETVLGGLQVGDGYTRKEGAFWTAAAVSGSTPLLTIQAKVSLGSLSLLTT